jgi:hypothetical protein
MRHEHFAFEEKLGVAITAPTATVNPAWGRQAAIAVSAIRELTLKGSIAGRSGSTLGIVTKLFVHELAKIELSHF